jgi:hypothetical protein
MVYNPDEEFMMKQLEFVLPLVMTLFLSAGVSWAAEEIQAQETIEAQEQVVFGRELMTDEERAEHRNKMRAAKTVEERERIQKEQHERMKIRAKDRGVTLPEEPLIKGGGMGQGRGMGQGKGRNQ